MMLVLWSLFVSSCYRSLHRRDFVPKLVREETSTKGQQLKGLHPLMAISRATNHQSTVPKETLSERVAREREKGQSTLHPLLSFLLAAARATTRLLDQSLAVLPRLRAQPTNYSSLGNHPSSLRVRTLKATPFVRKAPFLSSPL